MLEHRAKTRPENFRNLKRDEGSIMSEILFEEDKGAVQALIEGEETLIP